MLFLSPMALFHSVLCMLETLGLLFITLVMLFCNLRQTYYYRNQYILKEKMLIIFLGISVVGVILVKYNYGIIAIPAVIFMFFTSKEVSLAWRQWNKRIWAVLFIIIFCTALWVFIADAKSVFKFFIVHPSYAPFLSIENLTYYPIKWVKDYGINEPISIISFFLFMWIAYSNWQYDIIRFCFFLFCFSLLILTISTTNLSRHFIVASPGVWVLSGIGVAEISKKVALRYPKRKIIGFSPFIVILCIIAYGAHEKSDKIIIGMDNVFEGKSQYTTLQNFIVDNTNSTEKFIVIGCFDQFGIEALRWKIASSSNPPLKYTAMQMDWYPFNEKRYKDSMNRKRNIDSYVESKLSTKTLAEILKNGKYRYIIKIKSNKATIPDEVIIEFNEIAKDYKVLSKEEGELTVNIIDLKRKMVKNNSNLNRKKN